MEIGLSNGKRRQRAALTLLVVTTTLLVLAGIVLPNVADRSVRARVLAAKAQISVFGIALGEYKSDNGGYPLGNAGLQALVVKPGDATNWRGPYMEKAIPGNPWGKPYIYEYPGKHNLSGYDIYATGPDGTVYGNWTDRSR